MSFQLPEHTVIARVVTSQGTILRQYRHAAPWPRGWPDAMPEYVDDPIEMTWEVTIEGRSFPVTAAVPIDGPPVEVLVTIPQKPDSITEQEVQRDEDNRIVALTRQTYQVHPSV
jgi:hypothetical protein